jgi:hypothetical protein
MTHGLVVEGVAEFITFYCSGTYDYKKLLATADIFAKELSNEFPQMMEDFAEIVKYYVQYVRAKEPLTHIKIPQPIERGKRLQEFIGKMHKVFPYGIGPIIPATLFENGYTIEKLSRLRPVQMIRVYEQICKKNRTVPAVAVRPKTRAIFNLGAAKIEFNKLRIELGIVSRKERRKAKVRYKAKVRHVGAA